VPSCGLGTRERCEKLRHPGARNSWTVERGGILSREREGRRNRYKLRHDLPLRHPLEHDHHIGEILAVLDPQRQASHIA
jgi:hypothetical protein